MNSNVNTAPPQSAQEYDKSKVARELIHELQNHLHLVMMEVELVQMGSAERIDCAKLLGSLNSLKHSLGALREWVLSASAPLPRGDRLTRSNPVTTDAQNGINERELKCPQPAK
jgi:hypothetical protein